MSLNYQSPISFCEYHNLNEETVKTIVTDTLLKSDDGKLHNSTYTISRGVALRSIIGDSTRYAYANQVNLNSLTQAAKIVHNNTNLHTNVDHIITSKQNFILYPQLNPIETKDFNSKIKLLQDIDSCLRQNSYVKQVSISLLGEWQNIEIIKLGGFKVLDISPLVRLNISVIVKKMAKWKEDFMV